MYKGVHWKGIKKEQDLLLLNFSVAASTCNKKSTLHIDRDTNDRKYENIICYNFCSKVQ
jgi:hypothetical protein